MADRRCENCGKLVLNTDIICWHCGWQIAPSPAGNSESVETAAVQESDEEEILAMFPRPAILAYAGIAAVSIFLLLLTMNALGKAPIIALNANTRGSGWQPVSDAAQAVGLELPAEWTWELVNMPLADDESDIKWETAVAPLGPLAPDTEILLVGANDPAFLVVANSPRLGQISPQQAVTALQTEAFDNLTVEETRLVNNVAGQLQADFLIKHPDGDIQCRQRYFTASGEGFLAAVCTPANAAGRFNKQFNDILLSFQPLERQ